MSRKRKQIACNDCGDLTSNSSICDACLRKFMEFVARAEKRTLNQVNTEENGNG